MTHEAETKLTPPSEDAVHTALFADLMPVPKFAQSVGLTPRSLQNHARRGLRIVHVGRTAYVHVPSALAFYRGDLPDQAA